MNLLPNKIAPYAKAWLSLIGVVLTGIVTAVDDAPKWVAVASAVVASAVVYFVPNGDKTPPVKDQS